MKAGSRNASSGIASAAIFSYDRFPEVRHRPAQGAGGMPNSKLDPHATASGPSAEPSSEAIPTTPFQATAAAASVYGNPHSSPSP